MKIGIIGAGNVGGNLGIGWSKAGHEVAFGVRNAQKAAAVVAECAGEVDVCTAAEAAAFGDVVVLAVPYGAVDGVLESIDASGKVLIDCSNPIGWGPGGPVQLRPDQGSGSQFVAAKAPDSPMALWILPTVSTSGELTRTSMTPAR